MKKLPQVILLLGKPLSGKGTQAQLLAQRQGYEVVKVSDLIRQKIESLPDSEEIQQARQAYASGGIIQGEIVGAWVRDRVKELKQQNKSFILDGSPRTLTEAKQLLHQLRELYKPGDYLAIQLVISDKTAFARAKKRRRKVLDEPMILKRRLLEYHSKTEPAEEYLSKQDTLLVINGEQTPEKIYGQILNQIKTRAEHDAGRG